MSRRQANFVVRIVDGPIGDDAVGDIADGSCGAVAIFRGVVRAQNGRRVVDAIEYECYRAMAEREMLGVLREVGVRYGLRVARVVHRSGTVRAGETSVLVAVATEHSGPAFDALRDIVEALKRRVPIWKKEHYAGGDARWL